MVDADSHNAPTALPVPGNPLPGLLVFAQMLGAASVWLLLTYSALSLFWRNILATGLGGVLGLRLLYPLFRLGVRRSMLPFVRTYRVLVTSVMLNAVFMSYAIVTLHWPWWNWVTLVFPGGVVIGWLVGFVVCVLGLSRERDSQP